MIAKKEVPLDPNVIEAEENLLIDYQFLLHERMTEKKVSQSELAERAGISKARLSQILSADANPTVKTFARLFHALGERVRILSAPTLDPMVSQSVETSMPSDWEWAQPVAAVESISDDMITLMKRSSLVIEEKSMASNDNYSPGCRVRFLESEVAGALILEAEPETEAA